MSDVLVSALFSNLTESFHHTPITWEKNIPPFFGQQMSYMFGLPLNLLILWKLMKRIRDPTLPKYAYFLFLRTLLDVFIPFLNTSSDVTWFLNMKGFNDFFWQGIIVAESSMFFVNACLAILWKIQISQVTGWEYRTIFSALCAASLIIGSYEFLIFFGDGIPAQIVEISYCFLLVFRYTLCSIILSFIYKKLTKMEVTKYGDYIAQHHARVSRLILVEDILLISAIVTNFFRFLVYFIDKKTLTTGDPQLVMWLIFYDTYWFIFGAAPLVRAIISLWAFHDLLENREPTPDSQKIPMVA